LNNQYDGKRPHFSPHHINYVPLISHYCKLFGKSNVKVIPLELLDANSGKFISEIGEFVGRELDIDLNSQSKKINKTSNYFVNYHSTITLF
jgi:hypothetical protein